jgi:hypothetical protein|nr:MAG TPA: hypothetical protein [Caudoviricetes sp.]
MSEKVYGICGTNKCRREVIPKSDTVDVLFSGVRITKELITQSQLIPESDTSYYVKSVMYKLPSQNNYWYWWPSSELENDHVLLSVRVGLNIAYLKAKIVGDASLTATTLDVRVILEKL